MQKSDIEIREEQRAERKLAPRRLALALLKLYKRWVSPALPPSCRYVPTCSEYAIEAVERYGALRGGLMAAWRLLRCHPLAKGGLDPVVKNNLSSRPKQIIAQAMISAAEGPCVSPRLDLNINHSTQEMTSNQFGRI
jgi:uncharacterized protein